jgi:hypothetical protein
MATFPRNLQPTWLDKGDLPARPDIAQRFQSGADSNLRLSSIPIGGSIVCEWIMTTAQSIDLREFWDTVELSQSFDLPTNFFPAACDYRLAKQLQSYSPTGLWRFQDRYKEEFLKVDLYRVSATLRGAIQ